MEWISVKDKLPDYGVEVIGSFGKFVDFCEYTKGVDNSWFDWREDSLTPCEPTHWMPTPRPFNEE
jgi:hypothetical protein